jgi:xylose dehydrogenase (NAD/NADP)
MSDTFGWGILGTGNIAGQFAQGVAESKLGRVVAVGSRHADTAEAFARKHRITSAHSSYEALLADDAVDGIYLSLPNAMHHEWTLAALRAGKHVLCEKPFAATTAQAREMFDAADKAGRLVVEAFMYRSHPMMRRVVEHVHAGDIGTLKLIRASFCFNMTAWQGNVRFSPELAGGGLMDVGCYCVSVSRWLTRAEPEKVHCNAHLHESGVDDTAAATLAFPGGVLASFTCGMTLHMDNTLYIGGSEGFISVPVPWKPPQQKAVYTIAGMPAAKSDTSGKRPMGRQTFEIDSDVPLFGIEADDFVAAARGHRPPVVTRDDTLGNMTVLDELRRQAGLPY